MVIKILWHQARSSVVFYGGGIHRGGGRSSAAFIRTRKSLFFHWFLKVFELNVAAVTDRFGGSLAVYRARGGVRLETYGFPMFPGVPVTGPPGRGALVRSVYRKTEIIVFPLVFKGF